MNKIKIENNHSWDFNYYFVFKENAAYYKVEKTKNNHPLIDSNYNVTEAYKWFLNINFSNTKNNSIRTYNLVFPKAFKEQPKEFEDTDSVLVCSKESGVIYLLNTDLLENIKNLNENYFVNKPTNKFKKRNCLADKELYINLNNLISGDYTLVLQKNNLFSTVNPNSIKVIETLIDKKDTVDVTELIVYPNPASTYININFTNTSNKVDVEIINTVGQTVLKNKFDVINNKIYIPIQSLPNNIYYIKVHDENIIKNGKFSKN